MAEFNCFVRGIPAPQGSKRAFITGDRAVVVDANPTKLKDWRTAINFVLQSEWEGPPLPGPVTVALHFMLLKPRTVKRLQPHVKPDIDKLIRAALDSMTGICFEDDAQVTEVFAKKEYAESPGLRLYVQS